MKRKLVVALLSLLLTSSSAFALPGFYCGLIPLPADSRLTYVVYDGTDDPAARDYARAAYESILADNSSFFRTYRPTVSISKRIQDVFQHLKTTNDGRILTAVIVLGEAPAAARIAASPAHSVTLVPKKATVAARAITDIETRTGHPYYWIATTHAFQRGTRTLLDPSHRYSTITVDHILDAGSTR